MSGHETIRVLEVEVDAALPAAGPGTKVDAGADGAGRLALEAVEVQDGTVPPCCTGGAGESC